MTKPLPHFDWLFDRFYVDSTSPSGLRYARDVGTRIKKGQVAGSRNTGDGYWRVGFNGKNYLCHRIIHGLRTGEDFTDLTVDHRDRNNGNNHPFNLRWLDQSGQNFNQNTFNSTGFKGVALTGKKKNPFRAQAWVDGKRHHLGVYPTAELAHQAYLDFQDSFFRGW